jgi:co-chaperonin GroES (HSP10)
MNNTKIIPVGSKVLIKQDEVPEYYGNTKILISGTQEKENKGTIIAVGDLVQTMKPGDHIQFADHAVPVVMTHEGEEHLLINIQDILAIIVNV